MEIFILLIIIASLLIFFKLPKKRIKKRSQGISTAELEKIAMQTNLESNQKKTHGNV